jgi:PhnB protein
MYVPPGFGTVIPYIFADDAERLVEFMIEGLGGEECLRSLRPDGKIANAQVRIGTATVMISESSPKYPAMPAAYYLYVANAEAAMRHAINAGASLEMEVADMPYGDRQGGIRDPAGNIWWVSQRLVPGPYSG